jgi:hypothetical protein
MTRSLAHLDALGEAQGSRKGPLRCPYTEGRNDLDQIVCCWDGSRAAARAINDALPLLQKARDREEERTCRFAVVTSGFDLKTRGRRAWPPAR